MPIYSPAVAVTYDTTGRGPDDLLSSLRVMEENDRDFAEKLENEDFLQKLFSLQLFHKVNHAVKQPMAVQMGILVITSAMKNRVKFSIRQKERLKAQLCYLKPSEKALILKQVNQEIQTTIELAAHFVECDKSIHGLIMKAGSWFNDNMEDSFDVMVVEED